MGTERNDSARQGADQRADRRELLNALEGAVESLAVCLDRLHNLIDRVTDLVDDSTGAPAPARPHTQVSYGGGPTVLGAGLERRQGSSGDRRQGTHQDDGTGDRRGGDTTGDRRGGDSTGDRRQGSRRAAVDGDRRRPAPELPTLEPRRGALNERLVGVERVRDFGGRGSVLDDAALDGSVLRGIGSVLDEEETREAPRPPRHRHGARRVGTAELMAVSEMVHLGYSRDEISERLRARWGDEAAAILREALD